MAYGDRWRHVILKCQGRGPKYVYDPTTHYLKNGWRYRLGYNRAPTGNGIWGIKWSRDSELNLLCVTVLGTMNVALLYRFSHRKWRRLFVFDESRPWSITEVISTVADDPSNKLMWPTVSYCIAAVMLSPIYLVFMCTYVSTLYHFTELLPTRGQGQGHSCPLVILTTPTRPTS